MKDHMRIMLIFTILLLIIPCIAFIKKDKYTNTDFSDNESVLIYHTEKGNTDKLSMRDYIIGSVFAQMPADYGQSALEAQAVLAHTYICRRKFEEMNSPTENLNGADISDDTSVYQAYFSPSQAREKYKENYNDAFRKISSAADTACKYILTYDNEPIIPAYHKISTDTTESALDMWGTDIPYLTNCECPEDKNNTDNETEISLSKEEITNILSDKFPQIKKSLPTDSSDIIKIISKTGSGSIIKVKIYNDLYLSGQELASILSLPSPKFELDICDDTYLFTVKDNGHLVGMSQKGADIMSSDGADYIEILDHFFPSTQLLKF